MDSCGIGENFLKHPEDGPRSAVAAMSQTKSSFLGGHKGADGLLVVYGKRTCWHAIIIAHRLALNTSCLRLEDSPVNCTSYQGIKVDCQSIPYVKTT